MRRKPTREAIEKADEMCRKIRKAELLAKDSLRDWEKNMLAVL